MNFKVNKWWSYALCIKIIKWAKQITPFILRWIISHFLGHSRYMKLSKNEILYINMVPQFHIAFIYPLLGTTPNTRMDSTHSKMTMHELQLALNCLNSLPLTLITLSFIFFFWQNLKRISQFPIRNSRVPCMNAAIV